MKLGRVVGTVVSTINAPVFDGRRLLVCDLLDPAGEPAGGYLIAVDTVGAGAGETVLLLDEGNSARQILGLATAPVRTLVVGVVDAVELAHGRAHPGGPHDLSGAPPRPRRESRRRAAARGADPRETA
jgi:microcompartment protein CcmK/EutM